MKKFILISIMSLFVLSGCTALVVGAGVGAATGIAIDRNYEIDIKEKNQKNKNEILEKKKTNIVKEKN